MNAFVYGLLGGLVAIAVSELYEWLRVKRNPIVRCRDCKHAFKADRGMFDCTGPLTTSWDYCNDDFKENLVEPDGFCAWGTKDDFVTCKCGEDIERHDRIQICPSCGRKVMA